MRKKKIAENAKEYMDEGEEIQEMAMAQTVGPGLTGKQKLNSVVTAVAATDKNVYAFSLHAIRPATIVDANSWPLKKTKVEVTDDDKLAINDDVELSILAGAGKDAKKLAGFVSEH